MYAEVCIPSNPSKKSFTYQIPSDMPAGEGSMVNVPLRNRLLTGIITNISSKKPPYPTKSITSLHSSAITLKKWQLELSKWMSEYYFCSLQQILKLFIPKGKRTKITDEETK